MNLQNTHAQISALIARSMSLGEVTWAARDKAAVQFRLLQRAAIVVLVFQVVALCLFVIAAIAAPHSH